MDPGNVKSAKACHQNVKLDLFAESAMLSGK